MKNILELTFKGYDDWHHPIYQELNGTIWKDVTMKTTELSANEIVDKHSLYTSIGNTYDGEPNISMAQMGRYKHVVIKLIFKVQPPTREEEFKYMMLGRFKSDCEAHLYPYNNRKIEDVKEHIDYMKNLWNELKIKPEWLSFNEILEYESKMLNLRNGE